MLQAGVGAEAGGQQQQLLLHLGLRGAIRFRGQRQPGVLHRHAVLCDRAGFVGADHAHRAQGFHRREAPHQGVALGHALHVQRQGERHLGQEALRHEAHDDAHRVDQALQGGELLHQHAHREGEQPGAEGDHGDRVHDPLDLHLQSAGGAGGGGGEVGHLAEFRFGGGGIHQPLAAAGGHRAAREQQVAALPGGNLAAGQGLAAMGIHGAGHRQCLAGEHRQVYIQLMGLHHPAVGRHLVALLQGHPIAAHQCVGVDFLQPAVAPYPHQRRQVARQGLQGALGLELLPEGKHPVDQDHRPDRPAQLGGAGDEGQGARHPQQQRHEVEELVGEAQQQGPALERRQPVGPEALQAAVGLIGAEPLRPALQRRVHVGQWQRPDRLGGSEQHRWRVNRSPCWGDLPVRAAAMKKPGPMAARA